MSEKTKEWLFKHKYSIFYYLTASFLILSWFLMDWPKTIKIISSSFFIIAQGLYNCKQIKKDAPLFTKFINWFGFSIMLVFTIVFLALSVGELNIAIWVMLSAFVLMLIGSLVFNFLGLFKNRNLIGIIISYVVISILFIVLFGYFFTLSSAYENNGLIWTNSNTEIGSAWDYVYFSSSTYYTNSVGDIQPLGFSRVIMQTETAISFIFHVIILGFVVSTLRNRK
ncbi:MAG: hypothetical protein KAT77_01360 [Nanoarchaeota archaeon]|nr:hypothetical protein [Nanoarchaeota archaeon]